MSSKDIVQYLETYTTTNTGQVPVCSQEPVDSTNANTYCGHFNLFGDNTARNDKFHRPIIDRIGLVHAQLCPWVFKAATAMTIYCEFGRGGGSWGIVSTLKSLQKQLQRRHKQRYLKIRRYTSPKIDVFLNGHFNASSTNRRQCAGVIFGTPGTAYLCYSLAVSPNVYTVFPPRLSIRVYLSSNNC